VALVALREGAKELAPSSPTRRVAAVVVVVDVEKADTPSNVDGAIRSSSIEAARILILILFCLYY
jgi:hypothetical protein